MAHIRCDGNCGCCGVYFVACVICAQYASGQDGDVAAWVYEGAAVELHCIGVNGNAVGIRLTCQYCVSEDQVCSASARNIGCNYGGAVNLQCERGRATCEVKRLCFRKVCRDIHCVTGIECAVLQTHRTGQLHGRERGRGGIDHQASQDVAGA